MFFRKLWFVAVLLIAPFLGQGQSLAPQVVSNAGGSIQTAGGRLSWTLGEVAVDRVWTNSRAGSITEGFQQPSLQVKLGDQSGTAMVEILSNPVQNILSLVVRPEFQAGLTANLTDAQGKVLQQGLRFQPGNAEVDMSAYPSGVYFLTFRQPDSSNKQSFKVVKIQ